MGLLNLFRDAMSSDNNDIACVDIILGAGLAHAHGCVVLQNLGVMDDRAHGEYCSGVLWILESEVKFA